MRRETIQVKVEEIKQESSFVKSFVLAPSDSANLPGCSGGAHITTRINTNQEEVLQRNYSLINTPGRVDHYRIAVKKAEDSNGGSRFFHEDIQVGDELTVSSPKNHFMLSFHGRHHVFVACGIGITPFLSMIEEVKKKGDTFELHYAAKSRETCAFYSMLTEHEKNHVSFYFSESGSRMHPSLMKNKRIGSHVYFCGPAEMIKEFEEAAFSYGYPASSIHYERFEEPDHGPKHAFQAYLRRSDKTINVPEGDSLLDHLLNEGINAPHSCRIGGCGSCRLEVTDGRVDHRDTFLTTEEKESQDNMLVCVSRAETSCVELNI